MSKKERADRLLVERGLVSGRDKAAALILAGEVFCNGKRVDKAGEMLDTTLELTIKEKPPYVSRGGLKLKQAIDIFGISPKGLDCCDLGASTGGFTDCMLKEGASRVIAVDVGFGQLAWTLRTDERVINMERTNVRYLTPDMLPFTPQFATMDLSFISISKVLPAVHSILAPDSLVVCLVKPQFEAGREHVGKKGVVKSAKVHAEVLEKVMESAVENGFTPMAATYSPIKGPEGNIEYLLLLKKCECAEQIINPTEVVENAHNTLNNDTH